jgi:hypothetical protein
MSLRFSEEDIAEYQRRMGQWKEASKGSVKTPFTIPEPPPPTEDQEQRIVAKGEIPKRDKNKTESAYGNYLEALKHAGAVLWYEFEGIKLRLADNTYYTPDYAVIAADGVMEMHEVKGFWRDDARVKIKVAADIYPFRFMAIKKAKDGWEREIF